MDGPWEQVVVFLFACAMPASLVAWTVVLTSAGWLRDPADQPRSFRFLAALFPASKPQPTPNWVGILVGVGFLAFFNYVPLTGIVIWPFGWLGRVVIVVYLVAQVLWLMRVRQAIIRARSGDDGS